MGIVAIMKAGPGELRGLVQIRQILLSFDTMFQLVYIHIIKESPLLKTSVSSKWFEIDKGRVGFGKDDELALDVGIAHINIVGELLDGGIGDYVESALDSYSAASFDGYGKGYGHGFLPSVFVKVEWLL